MNIKEYRLRVMDYLLYSGAPLANREQFLEKLNERTFHKDIPAIGKDMLSKHIEELKDLAAIDDVTIKFGGDGFRYSRPGYRVYEDVITDEDKHLLTVAASLFGIFKGTPLQDKLGALIDKVLAETNSGYGFRLPNDKLIQLGVGAAQNDTKWLTAILNAIVEKRCIEIQYQSVFNREPLWRTVSPYLLRQHQGRWYFIGYHHQSSHKGKTLVFSLEKIKDLKEAPDAFILDSDFHPDRYFKYSIGVWHSYADEPEKVLLQFTGLIDFVLQSPIHHSQTVTQEPDGSSLQIEIEVYPSEELTSMILGFGNYVRVLKPEWLAKQIEERALQIASLYRPQK